MKTKLLSLFFALVASVGTISGDPICIKGKYYYLDPSKLTAEFSNFSGSYNDMESIEIPSSVDYNGDTYLVTGIANYTFRGCTRLVSVSIGDNVERIGISAFEGCTGLTAITIPRNVTTICDHAFFECDNLDTIQWNAIGCSQADAPFPCSLSSLTFGNRVKVVPERLFLQNSGLISVEIPDSVTSIGSNAFLQTNIKKVYIGNSVRYIGEDAFASNRKLDTVIWNAKNCQDLTSCPFTLNGNHTFIFGNDVIHIPARVCYNTSPYNIVIGENVSSIGEDAFLFYNGDYAFRYLSITWNTNHIFILDHSPFVLGGGMYLDAILGENVDHIPSRLFRDVRTLRSVIIPNRVTSIGNDAFYGCTCLTSITIPNSVTIIGKSAFSGCTGLKSVEIPNSVTSIGYNAFSGCTGLKSVEIPNSVTSIESYTFYGCTALASVFIPNSVTSIGSYAFSSCEKLSSITIPNSVTIIGKRAFSGCTGLKSVEIPNSVTSIESCTFYGCTALASIFIPNSVTSIGSYAFRSCKNLSSITIPNSIKSIGEHAFEDCIRLTSVNIPNRVTSIGGYVFSGCIRLTSVEIPNSVTSIGDYAFCSCKELTSITIPNSVSNIGKQAFDSCFSLASVTCFATSVPKLGNNAWYRNKIKTLYVPAKSVESYKSAYQWRDFNSILPISSEQTETAEVVTTTTETSVDVTWPAVEGAYTYELVIKDKEGKVICTLIFDAQGQLTSITYKVPSRSGALQKVQTAGFKFIITGLESGNDYDLTILAKDGNGSILDIKTISFTTDGAPQDIDVVQENQVRSTKVAKDGQILILRGDKTYTMQGQEVK